MQSETFLPSPPAIRRELVAALASASALDMAVAFVGRDWSDLVGSFRRRRRLVCWLTSTNTNPFAIEQMIRRGFQVRHQPLMHSKVYLTTGKRPTVIVGSANLSGGALSEDEAGGQSEAAVVLRTPKAIADARAMFAALWRESSEVTVADLRAAKRAWLSAQRGAAGKQKRSKRDSKARAADTPRVPARWHPNARLIALARETAKTSLQVGANMRERHQFFGALDPSRMTSRDLQRCVRYIYEWTGHPGAFAPVFQERLARVRDAFRTAFDEGVPVSERLLKVAPGGAKKLNGIGVTAWTLLLSWREPAEYPPYDRRTVRFLKDFGLAPQVSSSASARQYERWLSFASDLSERLGLPTRGHVDRVVWLYTKDLTL